MSVINTHKFGEFWSVSWTTTHHLWVLERFPRLTIPGVRLSVRHQHRWFWPILSCFVDYYSPSWGPEAISTVFELQGALTCRSLTLAVFDDLACFMNYYSLFWGPRVISTIDKPRSAFTCRSSTPAVFVDSDPFR